MPVTKIKQTLISEQDIPEFDYEARSFSFIVKKLNAEGNYTTTVSLNPKDACRKKQLIFSSLNMITYLCQVVGNQPETRKQELRFIEEFVEYINGLKLMSTNVLLDYQLLEKDRGRKYASTHARRIRTFIKEALGYEGFTQFLDYEDAQFLIDCINVKLPFDPNKTQRTLPIWFAKNIKAVGSAKTFDEAKLSSPLILTNSLQVFCYSVIQLGSQFRGTLSHLINENKAEFDTFNRAMRDELPFDDVEHCDNRFKIGRWLDGFLALLTALKTPDNENTIYKFMDVLTYQLFVHSIDLDNYKIMHRIHEGELSIHWKTKEKLKNSPSSIFFSPYYMHEIINHVLHSISLEMTDAEQWCMKVILASLSVQPSDIEKLKTNNFRIARKQSGKVISVYSEYFKSRAHRVYRTGDLDTSEPTGKCVITYLDEVKRYTKRDSLFERRLGRWTVSERGEFARFLMALSTPIVQQEFKEIAAKYKHSQVFQKSLLKCMRPLQAEADRKGVFGLTNVKNTGTHSRSDNFNPISLVNTNSHLPSTERKDYLSSENEEWLNNCGRITRAVMNDLIFNVFRPSDDKELFNSEFIRALEASRLKSEEILSRLKVITKTNSGKVSYLGLVSGNEINDEHFDENDDTDTIYLLDSPSAVVKLRHYLSEAQKHHTLIAKQNPDYFFNEFLPTLEWVQEVLDRQYFSKESMEKGLLEYKKFSKILPPIFTAYTS